MGKYKDELPWTERGSQEASNVTICVKWTLGFLIRSYHGHFKWLLSSIKCYPHLCQNAQTKERNKTKQRILSTLSWPLLEVFFRAMNPQRLLNLDNSYGQS